MLRGGSQIAFNIVAGFAPRSPGSEVVRIAILCLCLLFVGTLVRPQVKGDSSTPTFTTLVSFDATNGFNPDGSLVQGTDGNFYGTTAGGGPKNDGTLTTLYSLDSSDNASPMAGLVQATDGNLYGTTFGAEDGGRHNSGSVFEITPGGKLTMLYSFCAQTNCTDGAIPDAGLVLATNGNFYGTTVFGGANGDGTVFEITGVGKLTTLHSFDGADGSQPAECPMRPQSGHRRGPPEKDVSARRMDL